MKKRCVIEKDFMLKTQDISKDKGVKLFTPFGWEVTTILVPDYENTNIQFAILICNTIISKAKELGEITKIELKPQNNNKYKLIIESIDVSIEKEIEVPEYYGVEIKED